MLSGNSVIATSNLAWMASITCRSPSEDTKVIAKPLVPNRPARLGRMLRKELIGLFLPRHSPNIVKILVGIKGSIIVDDDVNPLNVNATTQNVGSDKDTFFKSLERGAPAYTKHDRQVSNPEVKGGPNTPFLLEKTRVNTDTWEIARNKKLVQFDRARDGFYEDDNLFGEVQQ